MECLQGTGELSEGGRREVGGDGYLGDQCVLRTDDQRGFDGRGQARKPDFGEGEGWLIGGFHVGYGWVDDELKRIGTYVVFSICQ